MRAVEILDLYHYNYWANGRIIQAAAALSEGRFTAPAGVSFGSLHGTLVHIYGAEWLWRVRCQEGSSPSAMPTQESLPSLKALGERWLEEEHAMLAFLMGLQDEDLQRMVSYTNTRGVRYQNPLWQPLVHVVNHGTQFRSEAAVMLTQAGHSPGDLDFIAFLREAQTPHPPPLAGASRPA
jgi:uncharacterized damage-inducible protein DinB